MAAFRRLIRFKDAAGKVVYGEGGDGKKADGLIGKTVSVFRGDVPWALQPTNATAEVKELLCPLPDTPIIHCVGVNYKAHLEESGLPTPKFPLVFTKPPDALAGPQEDILIDDEAQEKLDYEGELCAIIGKPCKNLHNSNEDPLNYVLGYTVGNDVSARTWQTPEASGSQHGYSKSFDQFAPIGPSIVSATVIPDPSKLQLKTKVNGEVRQSSGTDDLIFDTASIIRHLSRGRTLQPGTVIMTGTPSGVGLFMKPSGLLKDGDVVDIEIDQIGVLSNKMVFTR